MSWNDERQLLRRLRDLPPPQTPPGLEAKLLAGIPRDAAARATVTPRRHLILRWPTVVAGGMAAAAVIVITFMYWPGRRGGVAPPPSVLVTHDVQPAFVQGISSRNIKETRPCDILPPLHRSL